MKYKFKQLIPKPDDTHKYRVVLEDENGKERSVKFGAQGMSDFTKHHDEARKMLYLNRHRAREDWSDPLTPGFWSRWLLWNKKTVQHSLSDLRKRFGL